MKNGEAVAAFERAFADYVGATYAIALCNGTATLHTALVALGVKPGDRVAVPPLTMASTTIAVLHTGAVPVFVDVDDRTWLMDIQKAKLTEPATWLGVDLYGLHGQNWDVADAAQTLRPHCREAAFTSYSFQASKILALGEGGMLVTSDEELATRAREFSSLGYRMRADQPRIDPAVLKSPDYDRHHTLGWNYRMSDVVAERALANSAPWETSAMVLASKIDIRLRRRRDCADLYRQAIQGCDWLISQFVPEGWTHDYWTYAVAISPDIMQDQGSFHMAKDLRHSSFWHTFVKLIEQHGGERPYAAWKLTYQEPAFRRLRVNWYWPTPDYLAYDHPTTGICPVAEDLQPRLLQFQTNNLTSAEQNAEALRKAIREVGG